LDGHTASLVGTKLYLIAGGTYPEGHNPNQNFSLACSSYVYILETNPTCNPDGSIPPLAWRKLKLVQETPEDFAERAQEARDWNDMEEDDEMDWDGEDDEDEELGMDVVSDDEDEGFGQDVESDEEYDPDTEVEQGWQQLHPTQGAPQPYPGPAGGLPAEPQQNAAGGLPNIHPTITRALNAAGERVRRLLPAFHFGRPEFEQQEENDANLDNHAATPPREPTAPRHERQGSVDKNPHHKPHSKGHATLAPTSFLRPRVWHSATVVGTRIYIMGGRDMRLRYFNDVTCFDTATEEFVRISIPPECPKPPPRAAHGAVCPDNRHIYIFGGRYKYPTPVNGLTHRHYNDVWVFDTRNNSWKCLIDPPEGDTEKYMRAPVKEPFYRLAADSDEEEEEEVKEHHTQGGKTNKSESGRSEAATALYPAARCCFLMVLDPALPHKAHIVGGYTSSNVCFYYLGDSWTLDLLELSWTPMRFLPGSDQLNRVSIHTPTYFYDELILFAGEGSEEVMEVPYGSQQFLPHTTIFTVPDTPLAAILRYRDPVAFHYYQLSSRKDLSDVTIETRGGSFHLHRLVVTARMKRLNHLLASEGQWNTESTSLSSSIALRSSQKFTVKTCSISVEDWESFVHSSMPLDFFSTFKRTFDHETLVRAYLFAYTDTIHHIHRVPLDQLVQLYHLGFILGLNRLAAVALSQIAERLDPYFPHSSDLRLVDELLASSVHFGTELALFDTLVWFHLNSASGAAASGILAQRPSAITILPTMVIPVHSDMSQIAPGRDLGDIAESWLHKQGAFASLSDSMDALCGLADDVDADFELLVPASSGTEEGQEQDQESSCSTMDLSSNGTTPRPSSDPIRVHKSILIFSSPYLKALLSNDFKESQQGFAIVQELPYPMERSSLAALIRFMYGGSIKHIQDKNMALDILCNVQFFYSQHQELSKPIPHLGQKSTRLLRPRSLETELMSHCIDIVLSGEVSHDEIAGLLSLSHSLGLLHFEERLNKYKARRNRRSVHAEANATSSHM
jgi:hypothetical protein